MVLTIIGITVPAVISYNIQEKHTNQEALETAGIVLESALAIRKYTVNQIRPLLRRIDTNQFLAETVPAFSANKFIENLQKKYPEYSYREAVFNPTNLVDKASEWETNIINRFKENKETETVGIRETNQGKFLYISRPIKITNPDCLACHSTPDIAPQSMIQKYGSTNGFGWKLNEIVGAQIVTVPLSLSQTRARSEFSLFMMVIIATFLLIAIVMNLLLGKFVLKPIKRVSKYADEVSMGALSKGKLKVKGNDEIRLLNKSFNRMQVSLQTAVARLKKQDGTVSSLKKQIARNETDNE